MASFIIELTNLPEKMLEDIWKDSAESAKEDLGVDISPLNKISGDAIFLATHYPELISEIVSGGLAIHCINTAMKNQNEKK